MAIAALAVLIAILVLALRQIAVIMLILLAPLAIVSYVLPNTQRAYKLWWDSFAKALLMFPLIAGFIATGRVFSAISLNSNAPFSRVIGFVSYFAPYFLIPLTFKFAGGFLRQVGGFVNDRSKGGFDRLRNYRSNRRKAGWERVQQGGLYKNAAEGSRKYKLGRGYQALSLFNPDNISANPRRWRGEARAMRERADLVNARKALESEEFSAIKGDDDTSQAAVTYARQGRQAAIDFLANKGYNPQEVSQKLAHMDLLRRKFGSPAFNQAAISSAVTASTGYGKDPVTGEDAAIGTILSDIAWAADGNGQIEAQMIGNVKQLAQQAGNMDYSAPFSDMMEHLQAIKRAKTPQERHAAIQRANEALVDKIVHNESAGFVAGGKGRALERLIPGVQRRLEKTSGAIRAAQEDQVSIDAAAARGDATWTNSMGETMSIGDAQEWSIQREDAANREFKRALAATAGLHDVASQISEEKAGMVADLVLGQQMPNSPGNASVLQTIDAFRDDVEFNEFRNDIRRRGLDDYQQRAAAAAGGPTPGGSPASGPSASLPTTLPGS